MYNYVVRLELVWLAFETFWAESFKVDDGPIRALDVLDE